MENFKDLGLDSSTLNNILKKGFEKPSEIQAKVIPIIFEQKNDIIGIAQTGTGKTAAFGLPIVDLIGKNKKAIVLCPTRELALQVSAEIKEFKKVDVATIYGGAPINNQVKELKKGYDIVVGTPGRVVDMINRGTLSLNEVEYVVLDEADEMLKMGFVEDIEFILDKTSNNRFMYLFSATMPDRIKKLSQKYMKNQKVVEIKRKKENNDLIKHVFYKSKQSQKQDLLKDLIQTEDFFYGIVFCKTKSDVEAVNSYLAKNNLKSSYIHGDISQNKREDILKKFRNEKYEVLVATDVAARGIDVENLSHVVNYNLPDDVESYTHRVGRTGRKGNKGVGISLVTQGEARKLNLIEKDLNIKFESKNLDKGEIEKIKADKLSSEIENQKISDNPLVKELLKKHSAEKVVSYLLNQLGNNDESADDSTKTRVFIAKGKMDKLDKKSLIRFIENQVNFRLGDVDDVKICEKFSFLTLPTNEANDVVNHFQSRKGRSIAEIAQN